jgi:hypothetical protein
LRLRLLYLSLFAVSSHAAVISTKPLTPNAPVPITLGTGVQTCLRFPEPVTGLIGYGLGEPGKPALIEYQRQAGASILALRALQPGAHVLATVICGQTACVLDLSCGDSPEVLVTLTKGEGAGPDAPQATTPRAILANRPRMNDALLIGLVKRAHDAALLRAEHPDLYQGYESRTAEYACDCGAAKTTVTTIHRFRNDDATVIEGTISNASDRPISFDGSGVTVRVGNEVHPCRLFQGQRPIPAGKSVPFAAVIQGGIDGLTRANLSINNEYRLEVPPVDGQPVSLWSIKQGYAPKGPVALTKPAADPVIPRVQTTPPVRD